MGYDALPGLRGAFFNEIIAKRISSRGQRDERINYIGTSFVQRSDIAKFLRRFGITLS